ncbi:MAG TPA: hypothetical protein PLV68_17720, partial [Ilumatobacteraceae bacterium]|nr:hypothetical protein [Ilumatobacteraceae bacterium]
MTVGVVADPNDDPLAIPRRQVNENMDNNTLASGGGVLTQPVTLAADVEAVSGVITGLEPLGDDVAGLTPRLVGDGFTNYTV